jgi:DNA-binding MarR family transcriptional regulator
LNTSTRSRQAAQYKSNINPIYQHLTGTCRSDRVRRVAKLTSAGILFSELVIEVFRVNGLALAAGDRLTRPLGLTSARWQVMGVVDHAPTPIAHIARAMGLTRQSVRETADALVRDGFAEYVDNPHHRTAKLLALSDVGRKALRQVEAQHALWANQLGRKLGLAGLQAAIGELQRAREVLETDEAESD